MAQSKFNIDLSSAKFPLLSKEAKRSIVGDRSESSVYKPSVMYCHNVLPTEEGYEAVGYVNTVSSIDTLAAGEIINNVTVIYSVERDRVYLAITSLGRLYALHPDSTGWEPVTSPEMFNAQVTTGIVNGISYVLKYKSACYTYSTVTNTFTAVTLIGLTASAIVSVVGTNGYLIAFTETDIAWSSTLDPLDFTPSAAAGAGGGSIAETKGNVLFATANTFGTIIHAEYNSVACIYTGNASFPFKFKEIENSSGGLNLDQVAYEANTEDQFLYSKSGIQAVNSREAKLILPEVTDFLSGRELEELDESTNTFVTTVLTSAQTLKKKIKFIHKRYLIISYGVTEFTYALVFDLALQRLGKLRITHSDCFEYISTQSEIAKEAIAFVTSNGVVTLVDVSSTSIAYGVMVLGKIQGIHTRLCMLDAVELENIDVGDVIDVYDMYALKGKELDVVSGYESYSESDLRTYTFRRSATNHSILIKGNFELSTVLVTYHNLGHR